MRAKVLAIEHKELPAASRVATIMLVVVRVLLEPVDCTVAELRTAGSLQNQPVRLVEFGTNVGVVAEVLIAAYRGEVLRQLGMLEGRCQPDALPVELA